jgi:hypothetical protein
VQRLFGLEPPAWLDEQIAGGMASLDAVPAAA